MNSRERVKCIIRRKQFDRIPYSFDLTTVINDGIAAHYKVDPSTVHEFIRDDLLYTGAGKPAGFDPILLDENRYIDEFGVIWDRGKVLQNIGDWGGIISSPLKEPSLAGYEFPDGSAPGHFEHLNANACEASGRYVIAAIDGIFDIGWHARGFEKLLMDFATEEIFVENLMDHAMEYILGVISQIPSCVDGIRFGEDWGQQRGLLMGAAYWRKYLKPRLTRMYEAARMRGLDVFIHTCGDIQELFPDLIEMGVDVVNPVQPEVMNVDEIKREYGNDIVLYGGMGCQSTIPKGTPYDVIREARKRIEVLGKNGGYIFGPAGAIPTDAKMENVVTLVEFVMNGYR